MFRSPQILGLSCPVRPLLFRVRDPRTPKTTSYRTNGARTGQPNTFCWRDSEKTRGGERGTEEEMSYLKETTTCHVPLSSSSLDCETCQPKAKTQQNLIPKDTLSILPKDSSSSKPIQFGEGLLFSHCKSILDLAQNPKSLSLNLDFFNNTQCLQPQIKPWDTSQPFRCFSTKMESSPIQSHFLHREQFFRSTHRQWALADRNCQPSILHTDHIRALHQTAPCLTSSLRDCLSSENEERCRLSLRSNLKLYEGDKGKRKAGQSQGKGQGRWASVLVSLCSVEGEPAFLFTLRSSTLKGRHKGDVSFAGGKSDPSDEDVVATALREAQEELGITVAMESIWGVLKPLRDMSGMVIAPVLANLGPIEALSFKPNPGEVEEIFTLSLSHLCNPQNRGYTHFRTGDKYGYTLPVFCNGKHRVWGLTAVALSHTLNLLIPP